MDKTVSQGSPAAGSAATGTARHTLVSLRSGDFRGLDGRPVDVQVDVTASENVNLTIVGLPGKSTRESRDRLRAAIFNSGYRFPKARILVNLAPASREKHGVGFDLPVALGVLLATRQLPVPPGESAWSRKLAKIGILGELGLRGEVRPVRGALLIADSLRRRGMTACLVPQKNASEVALLDGLTVYAARHLEEAVAALTGKARPFERRGRGFEESAANDFAEQDFSEVRGQEATKRGCLVAAAGRHNVLLSGPPGVGKTMLARRLPGILPPLSLDEAMEVLRIRSALQGDEELDLPRARPFRAPHHTVSYAGLVGGGMNLMPGEVTRAHRGVLFLDEFPEFSRRALEALREPLEAETITIGRSSGSVTFPASFLLIAAMNPCPCGYLGHPRRPCTCTPRHIQSYRRRISGPLSDRLDVFLRVQAMGPGEILGAPREGDLDSRTMAEHVLEARRLQANRWGAGLANAHVPLRRLLRPEHVEGPALETLRATAERLSLSGRGFARALRVARTVADLDGAPRVEERHVLEALQFRAGEGL